MKEPATSSSATWEEVGLSRATITVGITTPDNVHWWWREQAKAIGLDSASFLPGLRIMRDGRIIEANDPDAQPLLRP